MTDLRIGYGYDVHRLAEGASLVLGGVHIPWSFGPVAHSDGDVLLHAICDALLGAAALGDIGRHFPDTDPRYRGASSLGLLAACRDLLAERGLAASNIDATVILERPKLAPHSEAMRRNIAETLALPMDRVSVKATTSERLGFVGEERGIAAHAVALLTGI
jgi:2-C-methyl-D-erythritol 2,4-cyclodiphosphate synthase